MRTSWIAVVGNGRRIAWAMVTAVLGTCGYVGYHAVQEDTHMQTWSPLAFALVDHRLRQLPLPTGCERMGYYASAGDGPKLPGSTVTLVCAMRPAEAEAWARGRLLELGFTADAELQALRNDDTLGEVFVRERPEGGVTVQIGMLAAPPS